MARPCPLPLPGDIPRGAAEAYRVNVLTRPTLPIRSRLSARDRGWPQGVFYRTSPAPIIPLLVAGMGGQVQGARTVYHGLAPGKLFPLVRTLEPWEGPPRSY